MHNLFAYFLKIFGISEKAANYYGYRLIVKTGACVGTVFVYALYDTKSDAYTAKGFISAGVKLEAMTRFLKKCIKTNLENIYLK